MRRIPATVTALVVAAALAGCTPQDSETTGTSSPTPTATPTADAAPAPAPADGWSAPASCTVIPLTAGTTVAGAALGPCIEESLTAFGSGKLTLTSAEITGTVAFTYDPLYSFAGTLETGDGPVELTFVDDVMWIDTGDGPVRGDVDSADLDEMMTGVAGELYRVFSDPAFAADLIAASPEWIVEAPAEHTPAVGDPVTAHRIVSAAPFSWYEIAVQEYALWVGPGWMPVAAQSTSDFLSARATVTQDFHDLGAPVTITPPE